MAPALVRTRTSLDCSGGRFSVTHSNCLGAVRRRERACIHSPILQRRSSRTPVPFAIFHEVDHSLRITHTPVMEAADAFSEYLSIFFARLPQQLFNQFHKMRGLF